MLTLRQHLHPITILFLIPLATMAFEPPSQETRHAAVGDLTELAAVLRRAFAPDTSDFEPIPNQKGQGVASRVEP